MRLAEVVAAVYDEFDQNLALKDVRAVCEYDRYQASAGITGAAEYVAGQATAAGLTDVEVLTFPADGARRWWTYRAPVSWTPLRATLAVGGDVLVSYPEQPYTLAAYSAPVGPDRPGGRSLPLVRWSAVRQGADPHGFLVVADEPVALSAVTGPLTAAGAVAVAVDPLGRSPYRGADQVGRLELPAGCGLAAFSVTSGQLTRLVARADAGGTARVQVALDTGVAAMPVVTGRIPGDGEAGMLPEILLSAHLCHPRPSANDNASGVAALLGIGRVLSGPLAGRARPAIRFLWGPEFTGIAAYSHDQVGTGQAVAPAFAINVDMAGQDVARCGGPLVIERGPDDIPSFLPALAARCAELLPPASRSYSGAVRCDPWTWRETPFAGGSDHALLADSPVRCQVVGLGHWPDRVNHSSADVTDLVDPQELRRTASIAGAAMAAIGGSLGGNLADDLEELTASWAARHVLATLPGSRPLPSPKPSAETFGGDHRLLDPHDEAEAGRWLRHRGAVALGAVQALSAAGVDEARVRSARAWIESIIDTAARRLPPAGGTVVGGTVVGGGLPLVRCWAGPVNLRALAEDAVPADRDWLNDMLTADRGGNYARALALMRGVNGERDQAEVAWWAALSSELAIPAAFAEKFTALLRRAGWVRQDSRGDQR
jgi:hypothetical protein